MTTKGLEGTSEVDRKILIVQMVAKLYTFAGLDKLNLPLKKSV